MRAVAFGTYDPDKSPRIQVLAEGLAGNGYEVTVCNAPVGFDSTVRVAMLRRPWRLLRLIPRLMASWVRLWVRGRRLRGAEIVLVGWIGSLDVRLARRLFPGSFLILDQLTTLEETAVDRRITRHSVLRVLRSVDFAAQRAAGLVCVDTQEHLAEVPAFAQPKAVDVWVGAPESWFRKPTVTTGPPLKVVFFGQYTPLQGAPVIGEALACLDGDPRIRVTMIGVGQELEATQAAARDAPNVQWLGWLCPDDLRAAVFTHDVCLGIFGTGRKALRVVPNKVFQGAAAGCAIVTSGTVPQRRALADAAMYVPPGDSGALAAALRQLADSPEEVERLRLAAYARAEERFRPERIVAQLAPYLPATGD